MLKLWDERVEYISLKCKTTEKASFSTSRNKTLPKRDYICNVIFAILPYFFCVYQHRKERSFELEFASKDNEALVIISSQMIVLSENCDFRARLL